MYLPQRRAPCCAACGFRAARCLIAATVVLAVASVPPGAHALSFVPAAGSPIAIPFTGQLAVGEFNGDSDPDLVDATSNGVTVLLGGPGGTFAAAPGSPFATAGIPWEVAVGDLNGDAEPDLAVASRTPDNNVTVLLGDGSGSFTAAPGSPFPGGGDPQGVAIGEFNGDSDPDLAVANGLSNNVSVLLGAGGGSFAASPDGPYATGAGAGSIAVGDFNFDSDPDLAVPGFFADNVTVLMGGAGPSFAPASSSPLAAGRFPVDVAVIPNTNDIVVANQDDDTISVFNNFGTGAFRPAAGSPFAAGAGPVSLALGEFNGDADADVAVSNTYSGRVSVLLGVNGNDDGLAPAAGSPFAAGNRPNSVVVGEFDGNDTPDLAVSNFNDDTVSVLLGVNANYVRPVGASPMRVPLVPAYRACRAPNRTHGPPLASPACAPPVQLSPYLTVGTSDANGKSADSTGSVRLAVIFGDVRLEATVTDVRHADDLSDYAGELQASMGLQLTDHDSRGIPSEPGTLGPIGYRLAVPCATTGGPAGSTCSVNTTANSLIPGTVRSGDRAVWQLGQVIVFDGGEDGVASTTDDNTMFMKQGIFVP
jgi:FG-GAP-like repeat